MKNKEMEKIRELFRERIEHGFYLPMDINKLNKKKVIMEVGDIFEERKKILSELLDAIERIKWN